MMDGAHIQGDQSPGKPGKLRELQSGQGKVSGNHQQFSQAREGKHIKE